MKTKHIGLAARNDGDARGLDLRWVAATESALSDFVKIARDEDIELTNAAEFASSWARDWLFSYSAGWVSGDDLQGGSLGTTLRHVAIGAEVAKLPPYLVRALLAIATEWALKTSQAYHGEEKPKTPPNLRVSVSTLVESLRFDEAGTQVQKLESAIGEAMVWLEQLLPVNCPTAGTVLDWHRDWRSRQDSLPQPIVGRPRKKGRP